MVKPPSLRDRPDDRAAASGDAVAALIAETPPDHFLEEDGQRCAGLHLIVDLWGARGLDDLSFVRRTLRKAVAASGATLLHLHLHRFSASHGISGVAVLAESHISIHTWPERGYAAVDVFMCGKCEPRRAVAVLREAFAPRKAVLTEHLRGRVGDGHER